MKNELTTTSNSVLDVFNPEIWEKTYKMAEQFVGTLDKPNLLLPKAYQANPSAFLIALDVANDPNDPQRVLTVMQNLDIIQGKPSWASTYVIAKLNASHKFPGGIEFSIDEGEVIEVDYEIWKKTEGGKSYKEPGKRKIKNMSCYAFALNKSGKEIKGTKVDMALAIKEGWYDKNGSKWQTMPEQMLMYRAATFFARIHAPEVLHGFKTVDEREDIGGKEDDLSSDANPQKVKFLTADIEASVIQLGLSVLKENGVATVGGKTFGKDSTLKGLGFAYNNGVWNMPYDEVITIPASFVPEPTTQPQISPVHQLMQFLGDNGLTKKEQGEFVKNHLKLTSADVEAIAKWLSKPDALLSEVMAWRNPEPTAVPEALF